MLRQKLSIIIPVLNEGATIEAALMRIAPLRAHDVEAIVVDGGSVDATAALARDHVDAVIVAPRGRAMQMNAGAAAASGDVLLFLHADTRLPPDADGIVLAALASGHQSWGRFDVMIEGRSRLLSLVAALMNLRSRLTGIATGDQAMFTTRAAFAAAGGFPPIALMEDIAMSRRLKRLSAPVCLGQRVITSGRRWDERGVLRTIFLMWRLRLAFFLGAKPETLARRYGYASRDA